MLIVKWRRPGQTNTNRALEVRTKGEEARVGQLQK